MKTKNKVNEYKKYFKFKEKDYENLYNLLEFDWKSVNTAEI